MASLLCACTLLLLVYVPILANFIPSINHIAPLSSVINISVPVFNANEHIASLEKTIASMEETIESHICEIRRLQMQVVRFSRDYTAMRDFASYADGARIYKSLTSPSYQLPGHSSRKRRGYSYLHPCEPSIALKPDMRCWSFAGSLGHIGITLSEPTVVTHVTIDHIPKDVSQVMDISSAPRTINVWGLVHLKYLAAHGGPRYLLDGTIVQPAPPAILEQIPAKYSLVYVGQAKYDLHANESIQLFPLRHVGQQQQPKISVVLLHILDNWGVEHFTCIYRVRVHGMSGT
ncbi:hypothetical protein BD410DRAFT_733054 [Rickenella mellea]|uniref:SUN domain-containing protein n=1 Tax=Rickenella mellea TaxID=50990 RepID=A0A4Y7PJY7_9AGAM|nr:hypothetical protein BD410DRAFT_733054 [Rickenella mellea]